MRTLFVALALLCLGCTPAATPATPETSRPIIVQVGDIEAPEPEDALADAPPPENPAAPTAGGPIPIRSHDIVWGDPNASVTVVWFTDLQCPFCRRVRPTLEQLLADYGSDLRIVLKHNPLPFHRQAKAAAIATLAVADRHGPQAALKLVDFIYERQRELQADEDPLLWAEALGTPIPGALDDAGYRERVEEDMALAQGVRALGTPSFRINGVELSGAQPIEKFKDIIDAELAATRSLHDLGLSASAIYERRVSKNHQPAEQGGTKARGRVEATPPDTTVWKVPIGASPVQGPANALVTLVAFSNFQCPFCARAQPTLAALHQRYPQQLRLVFKHNPLGFHARARPAALLSLQVQQQLGDAAFWQLVPKLFAQQQQLSDRDLIQLGVKAGLSGGQAQASLSSATLDQRIQADQTLAKNVGATGTPCFFINGRRLMGAQPEAKFVTLIEEQLKKAKALLNAGVAAHKVYDTIQQSATSAPANP